MNAPRMNLPALRVHGAVLLLAAMPYAAAQTASRGHNTPQWALVAGHLPDPKTATPAALELQGDVLRARRFPDDALDFYNDAIQRGGNAAVLLNKMGLTELEMRHLTTAAACFQRALKIDRKDAHLWNNLGVVEYLDGHPTAAVSDYRKAMKLDKHEAVFHSNLGTAYFEARDFAGARKEIAAALKLDPMIFDRKTEGGGVSAHVLSSEERARFSYEMARMYARAGAEEQMLRALARASEAGMDVRHAMHRDLVLAKYADDPRVAVLVHNAAALRTGRAATASVSGAVVPLTAAPLVPPSPVVQ
jgi:tetratricopeptide (TPR) repeat protein